MSRQLFILSELPSSIDGEAEAAMRAALNDVFTVEEFQLARDEDDVVQAAYVWFNPAPNEGALQVAFNDLEYPDARIVNVDGKNFTATLDPLEEEAFVALVEGLREEITSIDQVNSTNIQSALIDVTLAIGVEQAVMETAMVDLGFSEAAVIESRGREYTVDLSVLDEERDSTIEGKVSEQVGTLSAFEMLRNDPDTERMEGVIDTIQRRVDAFGITEPSVQLFGEDRVLVQLPGVEDTRIEVAFKGRVSSPTLENAMAELGFEDALVSDAEIADVPGVFDIRVQGVTEEERDEIRTVLEEELGTIDLFEYDENLQAMQVVFAGSLESSEDSDVESPEVLDVVSSEVSEVVVGLGHEEEDVEVLATPGVSFRGAGSDAERHGAEGTATEFGHCRAPHPYLQSHWWRGGGEEANWRNGSAGIRRADLPECRLFGIRRPGSSGAERGSTDGEQPCGGLCGFPPNHGLAHRELRL